MQIELFQREITTAAFKLAGGVDVSSSSISKPATQNAIPNAFITKITKAFLDALYAFLDGLVHLASDESPAMAKGNEKVSLKSGNLELLDLTNGVC